MEVMTKDENGRISKESLSEDIKSVTDKASDVSVITTSEHKDVYGESQVCLWMHF